MSDSSKTKKTQFAADTSSRSIKDWVKALVVLLVGLTDEQIKSLPKNIIGIRRTNSPQELAEIYTAADVFFNPTYEDNYPTVNLEAQACGTKVITYATGGAPETIYTKESIVVGVGKYQEVIEEIKR